MRKQFTRLTVVASLALVLAGLCGAATPERAITLGETRPLETSLGDPTLPSAQALWVEMIDAARKSVDLEHFYLSHKRGEALQPVLDAIGRAAARGVRVRLLLDARMRTTYPWPLDSLSALPGIEVRGVDFRRLAGGVQHSKFMVVDGRDAFLGSQNLDWRALSHIHEMGARIRIAPIAAAMGDVFETDWRAADTAYRAVAVSRARPRQPVRFTQDGERGEAWLSASPPKLLPAGVLRDHEILLARLRGAQREIVAQVLQYGVAGYGERDSSLHEALIAAAGRGVKVRLIVSDWVMGESGEQDLRALAAVPGIEVRISRVPDWSVGYIPFARVEHCKFMVADGEWLWLGTSNWEPGYFTSSRNLALTVRHRGLAGSVRRVFQTSWDAPSAHPLTADLRMEKRIRRMEAPPGMPVYGE